MHNLKLQLVHLHMYIYISIRCACEVAYINMWRISTTKTKESERPVRILCGNRGNCQWILAASQTHQAKGVCSDELFNIPQYHFQHFFFRGSEGTMPRRGAKWSYIDERRNKSHRVVVELSAVILDQVRTIERYFSTYARIYYWKKHN